MPQGSRSWQEGGRAWSLGSGPLGPVARRWRAPCHVPQADVTSFAGGVGEGSWWKSCYGGTAAAGASARRLDVVCCHVRAPHSVSPQSLLDGTVSGFSGCPHPLLVPWRGSPPAKLMITPGSASTLQLPLDLTLVFSRNVSRPCPLPWLILPLAFWGWRRASSGYTGQGPAPPR